MKLPGHLCTVMMKWDQYVVYKTEDAIVDDSMYLLLQS